MAAYRWVYDSRHLRLTAKNRKPTLSNDYGSTILQGARNSHSGRVTRMIQRFDYTQGDSDVFLFHTYTS